MKDEPVRSTGLGRADIVKLALWLHGRGWLEQVCYKECHSDRKHGGSSVAIRAVAVVAWFDG